MKKIIAIVLALVLVFTLCSCNYKIFDVKYEFNYAYVDFGTEVEKIQILSWAEDETTFTVTAKDGRVICTDQKNIVLVKE